MSKLRTDQIEDLAGTKTINIPDILDDLNTAQVNTLTGTQSLPNALNQRTIYVDTVSDLKSLDTGLLSNGQSVKVSTTGRVGDFSWVSGDQSTNVTADPEEGVWVAPTSDATGASGAWKRIYRFLRPEFFGADTASGDNSTALQAYFDWCAATNEAAYLPKGSYSYGTAISVNAGSNEFNIVGEGKFEASLVYTASSGTALSITAGNCSLKDFSVLAAGGAMSSGGAIHVIADRPTFTRVLVNSDGGSNSWADFFLSIEGNESVVESCSLLGSNAGQTGLHGIEYTQAGKSVSHDVINTIVYNCEIGYLLRTTTNPGIEGFRLSGGEVVNVVSGIDARNTSVYTPPMISVTGAHINSTGECIYVEGFQNVNVQGGLFYSSGNSFFFIKDVTDFRCNGLTMVDQGGPSNQTAFTFDGTVLVVDTSNCYYSTPATAATWAFYSPSGTKNYVSVIGNKMNANNWDTSRDIWAGGTLPDIYTHRDNIPTVRNDIREIVNQSGGVVDVTKTRATVVTLGNVTGSTTITAFTGVNDGRVLVVQSDTVGVTIQHNANLRLRPSSNFVMDAGDKLWLINNLDGSWEELSRATGIYP